MWAFVQLIMSLFGCARVPFLNILNQRNAIGLSRFVAYRYTRSTTRTTGSTVPSCRRAHGHAESPHVARRVVLGRLLLGLALGLGLGLPNPNMSLAVLYLGGCWLGTGLGSGLTTNPSLCCTWAPPDEHLRSHEGHGAHLVG